MNQRLSLVAAAALLSLAATGAHAQSTVYVGGAYIDVHSSDSPIAGGPATPTPSYYEVKDASTVGFGYTYRFTPDWSVEVALGIPPRHKTDGEGFLAPFGELSSVKEESPTVFANYHFHNYQGWQPFVGLGLNYTHFTGYHVTPTGEAVGGGPTTIKLTDSWGLAAHAGLTYSFNKSWSLTATAAYADVQSDETSTSQVQNGTSVTTTHIRFNPAVYTVSVGYSF